MTNVAHIPITVEIEAVAASIMRLKQAAGPQSKIEKVCTRPTAGTYDSMGIAAKTLAAWLTISLAISHP